MPYSLISALFAFLLLVGSDCVWASGGVLPWDIPIGKPALYPQGELILEECQLRPSFAEDGSLIESKISTDVEASWKENFDWYFSQLPRRKWPADFVAALSLVSSKVKGYSRWATLRDRQGEIVGTVSMTVSLHFIIESLSDSSRVFTSNPHAIFHILQNPDKMRNLNQSTFLPLPVELVFKNSSVAVPRMFFRSYQNAQFKVSRGAVVETRHYAVSNLSKHKTLREAAKKLIRKKVLHWLLQVLTNDGDDLYRLGELPGFALPINFSYGDETSIALYKTSALKNIHPAWGSELPTPFRPLVASPYEMREAFEKMDGSAAYAALIRAYAPPEEFFQCHLGIIRLSDNLDNLLSGALTIYPLEKLITFQSNH